MARSADHFGITDVEQFTSLDGTTIGCHITGSGPPLLLVHGTTADHRRWYGITPRLTSHFTVHAIDRRGRGLSGDEQPYDILREAEDIAAVVDGIGGPVSVLGHSYGAVCALEASVLTDDIGTMVLYEPPIPTGIPMYPPGLPERMDSLVDTGDPEAALELFFRDVVRMPEHELTKYRALPMWKSRIEMVPTIARELAIDRSYTFDGSKFADITIPTLLLVGGDSPPLFFSAIDAAHAALPHARVVRLPGQQHIAMDISPDMFTDAVLDFLLE